jgi:hypothetical protein
MSSWTTCPCGNKIGTGSFPNPGVSRAISESDYDGVTDPVDRTKLSTLFLGGFEIVRCSVCNRLLVREKDAPSFVPYVQENVDE